ncbi:radical SAM protein [Oxalobacteraceae bacterium CAVE-383]|nr:radical SAM protein [Oxalobacteraceae bacterium CAVE-383]
MTLGAENIIRLHRKLAASNQAIDHERIFHSYKWSRLEVILKVTERCNINCTYCYFFNAENQDFKSHPAYIKTETIVACAKFLEKAARESGVNSIQIDFHGGEPLMMKKHRFDEMCTIFRTYLKNLNDVKFVIQTNAILIDDEWIKIFAKHKISVGISLDGTLEFNDRYRLDHQGKGTYAATVKGLRLLQQSRLPGLQNDVGVICVIDPNTDAKKIFEHFVDELQLTSLHYLLPMHDHDTFDIAISESITRYLCDLFDAWVGREDPKISIRYFQRLFSLLVGGKKIMKDASIGYKNSMAFTIASNGDIGPADDLRNTFPSLFWSQKNVSNISLVDFFKLPEIAKHFSEKMERHKECLSCCWGKICDGGDIVGSEAFRYSNAKSLQNKSIYCDSIQALLVHMTKFSLKRGVPFAKIRESLIQ